LGEPVDPSRERVRCARGWIGGGAERRSSAGLTHGRELRRFNCCEQGKPALAPITSDNGGVADERGSRPW